MLSRVAEQLYWFARYIERAEDMARMINVHSNLLLDLPRQPEFGWDSLLEITGGDILFNSLYDTADERSVIRFLASDKSNPDSIQSCLFFARENLRTTRDIIPREAWELVNDLNLFLKSNITSGLSRRRRWDFMKNVIDGSHQITGLLASAMNHDEGYDFLRLGRNLERADMTTRIVDVRSADLLLEHDVLTPYEKIQWMSVLKSLTAYQMYRQYVKMRVRGPQVLKFLLQTEIFPRSFAHCLMQVHQCLESLPGSDPLQRQVLSLQRNVKEADMDKYAQANSGLHDYIDQLQAQLAELHTAVTARYFSLDIGYSRGAQATVKLRDPNATLPLRA